MCDLYTETRPRNLSAILKALPHCLFLTSPPRFYRVLLGVSVFSPFPLLISPPSSPPLLNTALVLTPRIAHVCLTSQSKVSKQLLPLCSAHSFALRLYDDVAPYFAIWVLEMMLPSYLPMLASFLSSLLQCMKSPATREGKIYWSLEFRIFGIYLCTQFYVLLSGVSFLIVEFFRISVSQEEITFVFHSYA